MSVVARVRNYFSGGQTGEDNGDIKDPPPHDFFFNIYNLYILYIPICNTNIMYNVIINFMYDI